jgi:3-methylfumaryl-CoA hydratase
MSATLDYPPERPAAGTPLPALWHWLYFLPLHRRSELQTDGHAKRGGFLPPVPLPRRMWAGGEYAFHAPLRVGETLTRLSTIEDVTVKQGRSGALAFVRVRHEIRRHGEAQPALTEHHDIVYRETPKPDEAPAPPVPAPAGGAWAHEHVADDVLLFRYSALTFNGHRIHYDRRYVTGVEGYPGLVVHGPLIATLLVEALRREVPGADVAGFRFRAIRPTFDARPFFVCGAPRPDGRSVRLWARDDGGWLTMDGEATLR